MRNPGYWNFCSIGFGAVTVAFLFMGVDASWSLMLGWICLSTSALMGRIDRRLNVNITIEEEGAQR